jgi:hypothetical protein
VDTVAHRPTRGYRTIRLPITEAEYERFMKRVSLLRRRLIDWLDSIQRYFPKGWKEGMCYRGLPIHRASNRCVAAVSVSRRQGRCLLGRQGL